MLVPRTNGLSKLVAATLLAVAASGASAQPRQDADALQEMFESFAAQTGPMASMFGKLTAEQAAQLERVQISIADENQFGERILNAYLQQLKQVQIAVSQHGDDVTYLRQLLKIVKPCMRRTDRYKKLDVRVIESQETDAFSIPGGRLLVTRGLLAQAVSEAAVVGVLAHELSHLDRGHQLIPLKQSKLTHQPLDFQDRMLWIGLAVRPNRPEHESEADGDAALWMMQVGYEAKELVRLLNAWDQRNDQAAPWLQLVPGFVKSHPDAGRRAEEVLRIAERNRAKFPRANYIGTDNLQQRSARFTP